MSKIDFSGLTPIGKQDVDFNSEAPAVMIVAANFQQQIRFDQNSNVAVFEANGVTHYYALPDGLYDHVNTLAADYAQFDYSLEQDAPDVVTGLPEKGTSAPAVNNSGFYVDMEGAATAIIRPGIGRYDLSYKYAKELLSKIDFSGFTPIDKQNVDMNSAEPAVVIVAANFQQQIRLDKATNIAVYETGGTTYYYSMPAGFYDAASQLAAEYEQFDYALEQVAYDVVTGF